MDPASTKGSLFLTTSYMTPELTRPDSTAGRMPPARLTELMADK